MLIVLELAPTIEAVFKLELHLVGDTIGSALILDLDQRTHLHRPKKLLRGQRHIILVFELGPGSAISDTQQSDATTCDKAVHRRLHHIVIGLIAVDVRCYQ